MAVRCLAGMAGRKPQILGKIVLHLLRALPDPLSEPSRRGAAALVEELLGGKGAKTGGNGGESGGNGGGKRYPQRPSVMDLVPYVGLLVVPLLGRMSDPCEAVRKSTTSSFASLVPLLPLAQQKGKSEEESSHLDASLAKKAEEDTRFLEQLLDNKKVQPYQISVPLKVTLRGLGSFFLVFLESLEV